MQGRPAPPMRKASAFAPEARCFPRSAANSTLVKGVPRSSSVMRNSPFRFRGKGFPFLAPAGGVVTRTAFGDLDNARARKSEPWSQFARALQIALRQLSLGPCFQPADGADDELHSRPKLRRERAPPLRRADPGPRFSRGCRRPGSPAGRYEPRDRRHRSAPNRIREGPRR